MAGKVSVRFNAMSYDTVTVEVNPATSAFVIIKLFECLGIVIRKLWVALSLYIWEDDVHLDSTIVEIRLVIADKLGTYHDPRLYPLFLTDNLTFGQAVFQINRETKEPTTVINYMPYILLRQHPSSFRIKDTPESITSYPLEDTFEA